MSQGSEKKARRIAGAAYHKLKGLMKERKDLQDSYQEWCEGQLVDKEKELYLYPDQANFLSGRIVDEIDSKKTIGRFDHAVVETARSKQKTIDAKTKEINDLTSRIADAAGTLARLINLETGEIVSKLHDPRSGQVIEEVTGVDVLNIDLDEEENPMPAKVDTKGSKKSKDSGVSLAD